MPDYSLYNKRKLCYTEIADFTDFQGFGDDPIYKRFDSVYSVVKRFIDDRYRAFFAHPLYLRDEDQIHWYVEEWKDDSPKRYVDLCEEDKNIYKSIRDTTIMHYKDVLGKLEGEDKHIFSSALKYIEDEYIYCYDNKIVLAIWGMTIDTMKHETLGSIINEFYYEKHYKIIFDCGSNGSLKSKIDKVINKSDGYILCGADLPQIIPNEGYIFDGWVPEPIGFSVDKDAKFKAQYSINKEYFTVQFVGDGNCDINNATSFKVENKHILTADEIPTVSPAFGYIFDKWEPNISNPIVKDTIFIAKCILKPQHQIVFNSGDNGVINGNTFISKQEGSHINAEDIPEVLPNSGYRFCGWDASPLNYIIEQDKTFTAQYEKNPETPVSIPWYKRLLAFFSFSKTGCLKWLLYLLLFLLLMWLLSHLFRTCSCSGISFGDNKIVPIDTITTANGSIIDDNGQVHDIIDGDGNLPDHSVVAPIFDEGGNLPPIVENPGAPDVIANRLNIYFDDDNADLNQFAKDFKRVYPDDEYQIIGCDDKVKMIQIQIPENERNRVRGEINGKIPNHKFFVVDESIFESVGSYNESVKDAGWHLKAVNLKQGWLITKGNSDIIVAVVDDGIDSEHDIFKGRIVKPYNVFSQNNKLSKGKGHGTHVAGLAAGSDIYYDKGISGVAPGCRLMPIQVFDNEICTFSSITNGIMYAVHEGADVVNISLGPSFKGLDVLPIAAQDEIARTRFKNEEKVWARIISIANKKNSILVIATGNDKILASMAPENRSNFSVNVAAVDRNFTITDFSNFGRGSNISAPGKDIYSSVPVNNFASLDGTSMSAPMVAGTIALMKSLKKDIKVNQVLGILQNTGRMVRGNIPPMIQVDKALMAVKSGKIPNGPTPLPVADQLPIGSVDATVPPANNSDDYAEIRRLIEEYKQKIAELEKRLPKK